MMEHTGLDKLCAALGLTGTQEDIFTLAAERIRQLEAGVWVVVDDQNRLVQNEAFHSKIAAARQAPGSIILRLYGDSRQAKFLRPVGHKCSISTGVHGCLTFGTGNLNDSGFWSKPCYECARAHEEQFSEDGPCWPHTKEQLEQMQ